MQLAKFLAHLDLLDSFLENIRDKNIFTTLFGYFIKSGAKTAPHSFWFGLDTLMEIRVRVLSAHPRFGLDTLMEVESACSQRTCGLVWLL